MTPDGALDALSNGDTQAILAVIVVVAALVIGALFRALIASKNARIESLETELKAEREARTELVNRLLRKAGVTDV